MTVGEMRHWLAALPDHVMDYEIGYYDEWGFQVARTIEVRRPVGNPATYGSVCLSELPPLPGDDPITYTPREVLT